MTPRTVAVVGLGLVGGSIARDLAARGVRVLAHDRDEFVVRAAMRDRVVHRALDAQLTGIGEAELVVLATPVSATLQLLALVAGTDPRPCVVMDVGSTKASAVAAAQSLGIGAQFVGSHPMAGDHRSGWRASRRGLFTGARVYLCPASDTAPEALDVATSFWTGLGAEPIVMDANAHDARLAWASHLPHVAATMLGAALADAGIDRSLLGPGGRDTTRLAGSSPELWADIARDNAPALDAALAGFERQLTSFRRSLATGGAEALAAHFAAAREWFDRDAGERFPCSGA